VFIAAGRRSIDSGTQPGDKEQIMRVNGTASQVEVVIVGAGQAGLAVSYYLQAFGVEHVVLERGRVGESWRSARWDSFTLVTPNWMNRLPGHRLAPGAAREFLPSDTVVSLLDGVARGLPVRTGIEVLSAEIGDGGYDVVTTAGRMAARAVVVASGGQRRPVIPGLSAALPADIHQTHAGRYRRPDALPPGAVLVVGSGQSGMQIATDLAAAGRDVLLATSQVARVPRRYRGRDIHEWSVELGLYDQGAEAVTDPAEFRRPHPMLSGAHGGQTLSYQQLARDGVRLLGRLAGADGGTLSFGPELPRNIEHADQGAARFRRLVDEYVARAGLAAPPPDTDPAERPGPAFPASPLTLNARAERISAVVWCTGFGPDTGWLRVPVLRPDGTVEHARGVTAFPGLYVAGHPWLSNRGSGLLYGVAADAARIAQHIAADSPGRNRPDIRHLVPAAERQPS
jgi:putative flavoprotein involved in K+ transport